MKSRKWNVIKIVVTILVCLLGVSACGNQEEEKIKQALIGEWEHYEIVGTGLYERENKGIYKFEADSYTYEFYERYINQADSEYELIDSFSGQYSIHTWKKQIMFLDTDHYSKGFNTMDYLYNDDSGQLSLTKNPGELSFKKVK